jgi:glycosyltransferase involved in cell wall biosynthesis
VNIWYDVSELTTWSLPHLTGIQRTTVGILNGLIGNGVPVRLVRYDHKRNAFVPLSVKALPAAVRGHVTSAGDLGHRGDDESHAAPSTILAGETQARRKRWITRETIFGAGPAAGDLRTSVRDLRRATRAVAGSLGRWVRERCRRAGPASTMGSLDSGLRSGHTAPRPDPAAVPLDATPFAPGDVLLSLGASWTVSGHARAAAGLRSRGVRLLRLVYDLIPVIKPQWVEPGHCAAVEPWADNVLFDSDHVFTISEFSKREIETYCSEERGREPPSISVVRLGDVLTRACPADEPPPLPRFVPSRPFFVCVSTLDVRKNHRLLYDAWSVLGSRDADRCPDLLCIGTPHLFVDDLLREIRHDRRVNGRIHVLHGIDDHELAWYYANSTATIYPSRYEGWGLPVAESLGHGKLCLASRTSSIPEISRDLPEFFDPLDVHELVALVDRSLDDPAWVAERQREIRERFVPTPWTVTAGQVMAAVTTATARREAA